MKRITFLSIALCCRIFAASNVAALWRFDEGAGQVAVDSSGYGNNGQLGSTAGADLNDPAWTAGKFGSALHFDGLQTWVQAPDSATLGITGSLTVEAWVKFDSTAAPEIPIISKWNDVVAGTNIRGYALALYFGHLRFDVSHNGGFGAANGGSCTVSTGFFFACTNSAAVVSEAVIQPGRWTHVAGVFDSATKRLQVYVDGAPDTSVTAMNPNIFDNTEPVLIGAGDYGGIPGPGRKFLPGAIDEARIWMRALNDAEVASSAQAGLRGLWHFNNSGADSSYGNDATLMNTANFSNGSKFGGGALAVDGISGFATAPDSTSLKITGSITVEAWVKINSVPPCTPGQIPTQCAGFAPIAAKWNDMGAVNERGYALAVTANRNVRFDVSHTRFFSCGSFDNAGPFSCHNANSALVISSAQLTTGTWHHIAGVFNAGAKTLQVFIDGVPDTATATTDNKIYPTAEPLLIGAGDEGHITRQFTNGSIDELHIWSRPLGASEIALLGNGAPAELRLPDVLTQDLEDNGAIFESDWNAGKVTPVMTLEFLVPNSPGTQISSIVERKPQTSTPDGAVAHLLGSAIGNGGLDALITGSTVDATALHLDIGLTPKAKLGVQILWSPGAPWI